MNGRKPWNNGYGLPDSQEWLSGIYGRGDNRHDSFCLDVVKKRKEKLYGQEIHIKSGNGGGA